MEESAGDRQTPRADPTMAPTVPRRYQPFVETYHPLHDAKPLFSSHLRDRSDSRSESAPR
jgi:hypothetical protein